MENDKGNSDLSLIFQEMHGFEYETANNAEELDKHLTSFYMDQGKPKLLEVFTPRERNDICLRDYFKALC